MKFTRITAIILILLMVISPAVASACALSCANGEAGLIAEPAAESINAMEMDHCAQHAQLTMAQKNVAQKNVGQNERVQNEAVATDSVQIASGHTMQHEQAQPHQFKNQLAQQNPPQPDSAPDNATSHKAPSQHNHCSMAGCHFISAATIESADSTHSINLGNSTLPHYFSTAFSADLLPPIKPPA